MIETIKGDILNTKEGVIIHQTNCVGAFGGGLAGQIARKYPHVRQAYFRLYYENQRQPTTSLLGTYQSVKVNENLTIVNMFGQYDYNKNLRDKETVFTKYDAVESAMRRLNEDIPKDVPIFIPYGLGCGLANGHWATMHKLLNKVFRNRDNVFIVLYEKL